MNMEEIKSSNKKIAFSAFIFAFLMVVILHAALISMIKRDYQESGKILTSQIADSFYTPIIGDSEPTGDLSASLKYQDFVTQTTNFLKNYPAANISIYDENGKKVYSSNTDEIMVYKDAKFMDYIAGFFLLEADKADLENKNGFSQIIWSADFDHKRDQAFVRVVEPMFVDKMKVGNVEVMYNFSRHLWMLDNTRFFCLMLVIGIIASYFILIDRNFKEMENAVNNSKS